MIEWIIKNFQGILLVIGLICVPYILLHKNKTTQGSQDTNNKIPIHKLPIKEIIKQNNNIPVSTNYSDAYKREYLLTINEKGQYWHLRRWADSKNLIVFTKVRLADLISPRNNQNNNKSLFWKIQAKHVDFVICDKNINVICIVELQDGSHNRADRIERDKFVKEVLESCGYKVIQCYGISTEILDRVCGYHKQEIEIRHDPTDHSE